MRFILGFIFFGLLFYTMSIYLPDAFQTLVSWAAKTVDFIREQIQRVTGEHATTPAAPAPAHAALYGLLALFLPRNGF